MARVAVLTMSDGRDFVARDIAGFCLDAQNALAAALRGAGHEVICGSEVISGNDLAVGQARLVAGGHRI